MSVRICARGSGAWALTYRCCGFRLLWGVGGGGTLDALVAWRESTAIDLFWRSLETPPGRVSDRLAWTNGTQGRRSNDLPFRRPFDIEGAFSWDECIVSFCGASAGDRVGTAVGPCIVGAGVWSAAEGPVIVAAGEPATETTAEPALLRNRRRSNRRRWSAWAASIGTSTTTRPTARRGGEAVSADQRDAHSATAQQSAEQYIAGNAHLRSSWRTSCGCACRPTRR